MEISLPTAAIVAVAQIPTGVVLGILFYLPWREKRRAENKVRMSDFILLSDIKALAKSNSPWLGDAIALYCAQLEQGAPPGD